MATGVARQPIEDLDAYEAELRGRLDPSYANVQRLYQRIQNKGYRYVFAEAKMSAPSRWKFIKQSGASYFGR